VSNCQIVACESIAASIGACSWSRFSGLASNRVRARARRARFVLRPRHDVGVDRGADVAVRLDGEATDQHVVDGQVRERPEDQLRVERRRLTTHGHV